MKRRGKLFLLVVLLSLSLACGLNETSSSIYLNFTSILPDDWQHVSTHRINTDGDDTQEWVVLYRFDMPGETEPEGSPIGGAVYRLDDQRPPCIIPYKLQNGNGGYLCEGNCKPAMEDVLSQPEGVTELVVRDKYENRVTRLSLFQWEQDQGEKLGEYKPLGHFSGDRITWVTDTVKVARRLPGRAHLAMENVYHPNDTTKNYYLPDPNGVLVTPSEYQIVFYQREPEDVMLSPYPEKVVLAFYNHYTTDDAPHYFTEAGWNNVGACAANQCGCTVVRDNVERVLVTYLEPGRETDNEEPCYQCEAQESDQARVHSLVICEHKNGQMDKEIDVDWHLVRTDDRWKLDRADIEQP